MRVDEKNKKIKQILLCRGQKKCQGIHIVRARQNTHTYMHTRTESDD